MDLLSGDVIKHSDGTMPRVMLQHFNNNVDDRSEISGVGVLCRKEDGSGNETKRIRVHHLLLCALDPKHDLFEPVHKFNVFCGCYNRDDGAFARPAKTIAMKVEMMASVQRARQMVTTRLVMTLILA